MLCLNKQKKSSDFDLPTIKGNVDIPVPKNDSSVKKVNSANQSGYELFSIDEHTFKPLYFCGKWFMTEAGGI